jgi:polyisoprenoid-binding protein YceI
MPVRYRFDPRQGRFTVRAFATGLLSAFGHSPTFAVRDFAGEVRFGGGEIENLALELSVRPDSLELEDRVSAADRKEIEDRMRRDVLETSAYKEITFRSTDVAFDPIARGRYRLRIGGLLSLHGVTRPHQVDAELLIIDDGLRLRGGGSLRLSDFRIKPVTALGGTIKLKDEVKLAFDILALAEES